MHASVGNLPAGGGEESQNQSLSQKIISFSQAPYQSESRWKND